MARPIWKGAISFGLVSIPIALYPATRREELKFRLLRGSDLSPVNYKRVAEADGVPVTEAAMMSAVERIGAAVPMALSSTAQYLLAGRRTEIDDLNGFVVRRGAAHGIPTPVNQTLHALVGLAESATGLRTN